MNPNPTPPPPGKKGRRWAGRRRYSTESLIKIAKTHGAYLIVPDYWISQRKRRHMLYDSDGEIVSSTQDFAELIHTCRENSVTKIIFVLDALPKPGFAIITTSAGIFEGRRKDG